MSKRGLSQHEIQKRLIRLRNLEYLHELQRFKIWHLRDENRELKKEIIQLKSVVSGHEQTINDLKLQIEELRTIVFGKKRKKEDGHDHTGAPPIQTNVSIPRSKESYKRKTPSEDEVTETRNHPIDRCARCHRQFSERDTVTYVEEDIPLPQKKIVIKHTVEKGYCQFCRKWSAPVRLPTTGVILGNNVKRYITYLSVACRQSYGQIQSLLEHVYDFGISQGEIANISADEGERLRPEFERLKARIRGEPSVHLDETGWNLFIGDGYRRYAWTMTGGNSLESVFVLGKTRGKGNANDLLGDSKAVVVSDDYGAYRRMENPHQLCIAHIHRKLRDLALSSEIKGEAHDHCLNVYKTFAGIYADIEKARASSSPHSSYERLHTRLKTFALPHPRDPLKMMRVKKQVRERSANYLVCLRYAHVASDNNAAERSLRHLVLKRKISFGSLTERTAETLAILSSVLLSWKQRGELRNYLIGV